MTALDLPAYADALDRAEAHANSDPNLKLVRASWLIASVCRERTREGDRARALIALGQFEDFLSRQSGHFPAVARDAAKRICGQLTTEMEVAP